MVVILGGRLSLKVNRTGIPPSSGSNSQSGRMGVHKPQQQQQQTKTTQGVPPTAALAPSSRLRGYTLTNTHEHTHPRPPTHAAATE